MKELKILTKRIKLTKMSLNVSQARINTKEGSSCKIKIETGIRKVPYPVYSIT